MLWLIIFQRFWCQDSNHYPHPPLLSPGHSDDRERMQETPWVSPGSPRDGQLSNSCPWLILGFIYAEAPPKPLFFPLSCPWWKPFIQFILQLRALTEEGYVVLRFWGSTQPFYEPPALCSASYMDKHSANSIKNLKLWWNLTKNNLELQRPLQWIWDMSKIIRLNQSV